MQRLELRLLSQHFSMFRRVFGWFPCHVVPYHLIKESVSPASPLLLEAAEERIRGGTPFRVRWADRAPRCNNLE